VLGYDALHIGLAFLPTTLVMGTLSLKYSEALITRFSARAILLPGLGLIAGGYRLGLLIGTGLVLLAIAVAVGVLRPRVAAGHPGAAERSEPGHERIAVCSETA
jgi:hypothetical protein